MRNQVRDCEVPFPLDRSAVVLAGGFSKRFGEDKGFLKLGGKPLVLHVIENISALVDQIIVVVSSKRQRDTYTRLLKSTGEVVVDRYELQTPLVGALTGFESAIGEFSMLLPCDTPFVSYQAVSLLLELCIDVEAAIPQWPNDYIEPLHAAYHTKAALNAANRAFQSEKKDMKSLIAHLEKVRYVPTSNLKQADSKLKMFFNINTPEDLRIAEEMLH